MTSAAPNETGTPLGRRRVLVVFGTEAGHSWVNLWVRWEETYLGQRHQAILVVES